MFDYEDVTDHLLDEPLFDEEDAMEALRIREHSNGYSDGLIDGEQDVKEGEGEILLIHEADSDYRLGYVKGYNEALRRYA